MTLRARGAAVLILLGALLSAGVAGAQEAAELLASPKYVTDARQATYAEYTREGLEQEVVIVSGRSSAWFGFNTPGVRVHLPRRDNSVYAEVEFSEARLSDAKGAAVAYEPERGIYDHDLFYDEYRFAAAEGSEKVPDFAIAEGTITVRYPLVVKTLSLSPERPLPPGVVVKLDGPFVHWQQGGVELPEAASFTGIEAMRVYDSQGRQLERHPHQGFTMANGVTTERYAYWGEVAELRIDVVEQWAVLEIAYKLPPAPPYAQNKVGEPQKLQDRVEPTPDGTVTIAVAGEPQAAETEDPTPQRMTTDVSPAEARQRLQKLGYGTEVNASMFVMSAVQGNTEAVRLFLALGLPVDSVYDDRTPLLSAAMGGHVETGKLLIEAGADVNAADTNSSSSLIWAAGKCAAHELVQDLVDAGADVNAQANGGASPLMMATAMSCSENLRILSEAGAK